MDNFTDGRVKRALDILEKLRAISELFISGYKGVTPDGEFKYELPNCFFKDNPTITISDAMGLIGELIDLWKEESEDKKTESHALDILKRIQTECPAYYKNVSSIEVTPSSEKLTFWYPDRDEFKDPEPELLDNEKIIEEDVPRIGPYVDGFSEFLDSWGEYENHRLEIEEDGSICIKYEKPDGTDWVFYLNRFARGLRLIADEYKKK